jgi:uncharacterized membrane protein YkoI
MPITRTRRLVSTAAIAFGLVAGAAGIAAAATSQASTPEATSAPTDTETNDPAPSYHSSVTAPDDENEGDLAQIATITTDEARAAAVNATGGTAGDTELENEDGNVVYGVEITLPDGTMLDVKVDAGNATILAQEPDEADGNETGETGETGGVDCEDGLDATTGADCDGGPSANADNDPTEAPAPEDD